MKDANLLKLDRFFSKCIPLYYKKSETILRPEDTPQGVYYLKKGYVRSYSLSESGKETTIAIYKSNSCFPVSWALLNLNNPYFYEAITKIKVYRSQKEKFLKFLSQKPEIFSVICNNLLLQFETTCLRVQAILSCTAYKRVVSALLLIATIYGHLTKQTIIISIPLTHLFIASIAGLTRETTSNIMTQLSKKGIISYTKKKIVINDLELLRTESGLTNNTAETDYAF